MSRTIRRLPTGRRSKKYRNIGYYNRVWHVHTRAAHLLKTPLKPQQQGRHERRHGLWLFTPNRWTYSRPDVYSAYTDLEPRPCKFSIAGPKWVDRVEFESPWVQRLIAQGWTYNSRYESRSTGPEEWDYVLVDLGPDFRDSWVWRRNPDFDTVQHDAYLEWLQAHQLVYRNGHYKGHRSGYAKFMRRDKQADHQVERSRRAADLRKLVAEANVVDDAY